MQRTVTDCDRCGKSSVKRHSFRAFLSRRYNGVDYDSEQAAFDLCEDCMDAILSRIIREFGWDGKANIEWVNKYIGEGKWRRA